MKLIAQLKLLPTPEQADALKRTLEAANAACNSISHVAWANRTFGKFALQKLCHQDVGETFGLAAQMTILALAKVGDAYKLDKKTKPPFARLPALPMMTVFSPLLCPIRPFRSGHLTGDNRSGSSAAHARKRC